MNFGSSIATATIANALQIGSTARDNALAITAARTYPSSISTGGMVNFTCTNSDTSCLTLSDAHGAGKTARTFTVQTTNTAYDQETVSFQSVSATRTTLGVIGSSTAQGTVKITHNGIGTDANASGLSIDLAGLGTAAQGLFIDATQGGTTGKLLNIRNNGIEYITASSTGFFGLSSTTPAERLGVHGNIFANGNITGANITATGTLSGTTLNTGNGAYELYAMDQNVLTTSNVSFDTVTASTLSGVGGASIDDLTSQSIDTGILSVSTSASIASTTLTGNTLLSKATTTSFAVTNLVNCDTIDTTSTGVLKCGTDSTTAGTNPFTWTSTYGALNAATSSNLWAQGSSTHRLPSHLELRRSRPSDGILRTAVSVLAPSLLLKFSILPVLPEHSLQCVSIAARHRATSGHTTATIV